MSRGAKGTSGETTRLTVPKGTGLLVAELVASKSRGEGKLVPPEHVLRVSQLVGLLALRKCLACATGAGPCSAHAEAAVLAALGLESLDAALAAQAKAKSEAEERDGKEHQALVDLFDRGHLAARGIKPRYSGPMMAVFKRLRKAHGFDVAKTLIEAAFRDSKWIAAGCPLAWVESNPNGFAAVRSRSATSTLQREPDFMP